MRTIREVLRLKWLCGLSNRDIAASCRIGPTAVRGYVRRAEQAGLRWPLPENLQDLQLDQLLFPPPEKVPANQRALPPWSEVHKELKRKGVTLQLLWEEYRGGHPNGYGYSRYCELYARWARTAEPTMVQEHKAGDKLFVDYAGLRMPLIDPKTGQITEAQIFVGALGASSYIFAEATLTQSVPDWIGSHVRCFAFLGGVPRIVVPDNLKSGVTSPCRYEPDINPTYLALANHYGVAIVPARVRKPRDKAKAENAVQQVERRILAPLRNHTFHALAQINAAMVPLLAALNEEPSKSLGNSRKELFETIDRPALRPLPLQPFSSGLWSKARVNLDYHLVVDLHRYSVPYTLIGSLVEVHLTERTVEIFHGGSRVASHIRSHVRHGFTTLREHMPQRHQKRHGQEQRFLSQAREHGPQTERLVAHVLESRPIREQSYRSCLGLLHLGDKYGSQRMEAACERALLADIATYKSVAALLKNGLDKMPLPNEQGVALVREVATLTPLMHNNIRGADYYRAHNQQRVALVNEAGASGPNQQGVALVNEHTVALLQETETPHA